MDVNHNEIPHTPPVAIISMGGLFPRASGLKSYWRLLYHGLDAITDVPSTHWSVDDYFDEDTSKADHVYCRRGGFLSPIPFDPTAFGIPPSNLEATDTSQLLGLIAAKAALEQAGYGENADFDRDRTAVILGVTGTQELVIPLGARLSWPKWKRALETAGVEPQKTRAIMAELSSEYVPWRENSFPGLLGNVVAGRICNRLDLSGTNCVVDAACASSMSAINLALMELYTGRSRMVVTGGVDTLNDIFMHMCFART
jgi:acyl transferase domain-containing protein